jgi:hypothetical protein
METAETKVTIRCRPFNGILNLTKCLVNLDEKTIHVWDSVGKQYTLCHSLSKRDQGRILSAARKSLA